MTHTLTIKAISPDARNVFSYDLEKPDSFSFQPGQATEVSIDKDGWRDQKRPFTFTSLPGWDRLQFTIKSYHDHDGVTDQLSKLLVGDQLIIDDPWGAITYKGKGVFIAGGAGVTPFIAIFRQLHDEGNLAGHTLLFANKTERDIIHREEFEALPGLTVRHILSQEERSGLDHGHIDGDYLRDHVSDFDQHFYVCGPDQMVEEINATLSDLGAKPDSLVFEK
ncbi:flavodoxin reductase [Oricola cellulosilytica]|uniref:Flavodoxin reductase n=1 Tax=Oricola cellulosilytica TaxID=1429082 RepID=A0A4R0PCT1_9HYPH|nr:flavodoxin reductase [Oricola cellulosilytica]TCD15096.1 flavodoxin reductase [Oricola cellulosilytica]